MRRWRAESPTLRLSLAFFHPLDLPVNLPDRLAIQLTLARGLIDDFVPDSIDAACPSAIKRDRIEVWMTRLGPDAPDLE